MTLITNYLTSEYIILAADKKQLDIEKKEEYSNEAVKLILGNNYAIGIQGFIRTKTVNYKEQIENFVKKNPILSREETASFLEIFPDILNDNQSKDLNLTISGFDDEGLFSMYYDLRRNKAFDLYEVDENGLRLNQYNQGQGLFGQGIRYLNKYFRENKGYDKFTGIDLELYDQESIVEALKVMYERFDGSVQYPTIGREVDYAIITNKKILPFISIQGQ